MTRKKETWWLDYGDIDHAYDFIKQETEPDPQCGVVYGPFKSFYRAKNELIFKLTDDRNQLRSQIAYLRSKRKP